MTIERYYRDGPIAVRCDACADGSINTETVLFHDALATIKGEGWQVRPINGAWLHFCPDCGAPEPMASGVRQ